MRPAAEELAKALRSGLQWRWSIPATHDNNPFPPHGDVRSYLEPVADSLRYRLLHRRRPLDRFVRGWHYLVRMLIAPWLHVHSLFNLSTVRVLEQVEQRVRALEEAERALRQAVEHLEKKRLTHSDYQLSGLIDSREER